MANVKNRMELKMTTESEQAIKWFSKIHFKDRQYCDGLCLIEIQKKDIEDDKPICVGTPVLDLSKLCMTGIVFRFYRTS